MYTYQQEFVCHYSRLSSVLDMDSVISQQSLREVQLGLFFVLDRAGNSCQKACRTNRFLFLMVLSVLKVQNIKYFITVAEEKKSKKTAIKSL